MLGMLHRHARANAVAYAALFVALSGTALAAGGLARNSVGTRQLRNRSVTGIKVARKTLTGSNIRVLTLGTVPDAFRLDHRPASAYQTRVSGSCGTNRAIAQIDASGGVSCRTISGGTITRVAAGTDLTGGGSTGTVTLGADENKLQHRVSGACASGTAIASIAKSGSVSCQSSNVTQMSGGSIGAVSTGAASFLAPTGLSTPSAAETDVDTLGSALQSTAASLSARVTVAPGGASSWRFVLVVNGGAAAVQCTIAGSATTCSDTSNRVAVPAGARVALEAIPSGSPAAGARLMFGWTAST